MPLIKAQCTNCGGILDVDQCKEAAVCPFCNTPYIVEKAINLYKTEIVAAGATINVSQTALDADTMFENWLVSRNAKLEQDFSYFYASDPRNEYIKIYRAIKENPIRSGKEAIHKAMNLADRFLSSPRFDKFKKREIDYFSSIIDQLDERNRRLKNNLIAEENAKHRKMLYIIAVISSIIVIILFINCNPVRDVKDWLRYDDFVSDVERGRIETVKIFSLEKKIIVTYSDDSSVNSGKTFYSNIKAPIGEVKSILEANNVSYSTSNIYYMIFAFVLIVIWVGTISTNLKFFKK